MSTKKIGRPRRACRAFHRLHRQYEPLRARRGDRCPPARAPPRGQRAPRPSPRGALRAARPAAAERLATQSRSTPRERRFRAASSPAARADEQDRPLLDVVEDAGSGSATADETDAEVLTDASRGARALADVQRLAEEAVQDRTDDARVLGRLVGAPHLAEDLDLAGDGGQPGRYAEEVKSGLPILLDVQRALESARGRPDVATSSAAVCSHSGSAPSEAT